MDNKFEVYESGQYCEEILIKQGRQEGEPREPVGFDFHRTVQKLPKAILDMSHTNKYTNSLSLLLPPHSLYSEFI